VEEEEEGREEEEEEVVVLVMVSKKEDEEEKEEGGDEEGEKEEGVARCNVLSTLSLRTACASGERPMIFSTYARAFSGAGARTAAKTTNSNSLIMSLLRFSRAIPARSSEAKYELPLPPRPPWRWRPSSSW
jgi:hypothetical protein